MTDASSPPPVRVSPTLDTARLFQNNTETKGNLLIVTLPEALRTNKTTIQIQGKVKEQRPDGSLLIDTPKGEIIAKPEITIQVKIGQNVEIRIPNIDVQRQASIRIVQDQKPALAPQENLPKIPVSPPTRDLRTLIMQGSQIPLKTFPSASYSEIIKPFILEIKTTLTSRPLPYPAEMNVLPFYALSPEKTITASKISMELMDKIVLENLNFSAAGRLKNVTPQVQLITSAQGLLDLLKSDNMFFKRESLTPLASINLQILAPAIENGDAPFLTKPQIQSQNFSPLDSIEKTNLNAPPLILASLKITYALPAPVILFTSLNPVPPLAVQDDLGTNETLPQPTKSDNTPQSLSEPFIKILKPLFSPQEIQTPSLASETNKTKHLLTARFDQWTAEIIGLTPERLLPVLKFINQPLDNQLQRLFIIDLPIQDITLGTQLELSPAPSVISTKQNTQTSSLQIFLPLKNMTASLGFTALQEIQNILTQTAPTTANSLNKILPQAANPQQIGPAALFFLAALRSGDFSSWLGEKSIDALKRAGKSDLVSKLTQELSILSRSGNEPITQEWRASALPLSWNQEIQKISIHYKNEERRDQDNQKTGSGSTRFLMNLSLSNLGAIQIDGLFQKNQKTLPRLEMILRSAQIFSEHDQSQMRTMFKSALEETGMSGDLSFQTNPAQWVHITLETNPSFSEKI